MLLRRIVCLVLSVCRLAAAAAAQSPAKQPPDQNPHARMAMEGWQFMYDGVMFGMFDHQGGPRGGDGFKVPNWGMGMLTRPIGERRITFSGMLSLDPAAAARKNAVGATTFGAMRHLGKWHGLDRGLGGALTLNAVPQPLVAAYGPHPVSFQLFLRLQPAAGRMWNMRMSRPMPRHAMNE